MNSSNYGKGTVVTANYTDRNSDHPWLIRSKRQKPENAAPFKAVMATGITFKPSEVNGYEAGFGCSIVAVCATAEGVNTDPQFDKKKTHKLRFCGSWFQDVVTKKEVKALDALYLTTNGEMYGLIPEPATKEKASKEELREA